MNSRDALVDWKAFSAGNIPTKGIRLPPVFNETLHLANSEKGQLLHILELGCGCGELAFHLASRGHRVVGIDANEGAIALAEKQRKLLDDDTSTRVNFLVDDVTSFRVHEHEITGTLTGRIK